MKYTGKILFFLSSFLLMTTLIGSTVYAEKKLEESKQIADFLHLLQKKASSFNSLQTDFIQEKELSLFKSKLVIKGRIYLLKPSKIIWRVNEPMKYSVLITDKFLRQWDEETKQVQEIKFDKNPVLKIVFQYLNGWFSGDYTVFLKDYEVRILQKEPSKLEFVPKGKSAIKKIISKISICLQQDARYLKWIKIQHVGNDVTTIYFSKTVFNPSLDKSIFEVNGGV